MARTLGIALMVALLAGCQGERAPPAWYPLQPGLWARYHLAIRLVMVRQQGERVVQGLPPVVIDGERLHRQRVNADIVRLFRVTDDGVWLVGEQRAGAAAVHRHEPPRLVLPHPLEVGSAWPGVTRTEVLETVVSPFRRHYRLEIDVPMDYRVVALDEPVAVPAGHFAACAHVRGEGSVEYPGDKTLFATRVSVTQDDWYAPGVGLVRSVRVERTGSRVLPEGRHVLELERIDAG